MANAVTYATRVKVGLGGRFRDLLINESYVVACWTHDELQSLSTKDIFSGRNVGTHGGTGTTRGTTVTTLPEGALMTTFTGFGYVTVPDDGNGFTRPGDSSGRNMSLANGAFDEVIFFKTSTNDAVERHIISKINGTTSGWKVYIINGTLVCKAYKAGVLLFTLTSGTISDGVEHVAQICYTPGSNLARLLIDGVSVSTAASAVELAITTQAVFIGASGTATAAAGTGFVGSLGFIMLSREGNSALAASLELARVWTTLSDKDVLLPEDTPMDFMYGSMDSSPLVRMAGPNTAVLQFNNSTKNSAGLLGYYTRGHANCRAGWGLNCSIMVEVQNPLTLVWKTVFRGQVQDIIPTSGQNNDRRVSVVAATWLTYGAKYPVGAVPLLTSASSSAAFARLVDNARVPPPSVSIDTGTVTFAWALDNVQPTQTLYDALATIATDEGGYVFEKMDGTLTFANANNRFGTTTFAATFNGSVHDIDAGSRGSDVINTLRVRYTPRVVGTPASQLAVMTSRVLVPAGDTVMIAVTYRDPAQKATKVGASTVITPVATTDYTMNTAQDGTGGDITSSATIVGLLQGTGGNSMTMIVSNTSATPGWFMLSQLRGTPLLTYDAVEVVVIDGDSVRDNGPRDENVQLTYTSVYEDVVGYANRLLTLYKNPEQRVGTLEQIEMGDGSLGLLNLDMNSLVGVGEYMTALDSSKRRFINGIHVQVSYAKLEMTMAVSNSAIQAFWILGVVGYAELGTVTYNA